ncbi:MAG: hypothetical protein QY312_01210 [Candidatus Dojkabacteria bacterium]|nr:MAG: hypothetical protein QY312_01210 [Candidatus Dojkabacteria bacterium]
MSSNTPSVEIKTAPEPFMLYYPEPKGDVSSYNVTAKGLSDKEVVTSRFNNPKLDRYIAPIPKSGEQDTRNARQVMSTVKTLLRAAEKGLGDRFAGQIVDQMINPEFRKNFNVVTVLPKQTIDILRAVYDTKIKEDPEATQKLGNFKTFSTDIAIASLAHYALAHPDSREGIAKKYFSTQTIVRDSDRLTGGQLVGESKRINSTEEDCLADYIAGITVRLVTPPEQMSEFGFAASTLKDQFMQFENQSAVPTAQRVPKARQNSNRSEIDSALDFIPPFARRILTALGTTTMDGFGAVTHAIERMYYTRAEKKLMGEYIRTLAETRESYKRAIHSTLEEGMGQRVDRMLEDRFGRNVLQTAKGRGFIELVGIKQGLFTQKTFLIRDPQTRRWELFTEYPNRLIAWLDGQTYNRKAKEAALISLNSYLNQRNIIPRTQEEVLGTGSMVFRGMWTKGVPFMSINANTMKENRHYKNIMPDFILAQEQGS